MRIFMSVFLSAALFFPASWASAQIITHEQLQKLDKSNLGGGEGTVNAAFAFTRDNATSGQVIKEIGWLTLMRIPMIPVSDSGDFDRASRAGYFLL